jgi:dTDP-4-dehydrorhamnose reductase
MKKKRILITGGSGLLALNWACAIRGHWDVVLGIHRQMVNLKGTSSSLVKFDTIDDLELNFDSIAPDMVVHTAGMTDVDACEKDPCLAVFTNAEIARNIAKVTTNRNIPLVHISTDHLFNGDNSFYREDSITAPLNQYGYTKLLAEEWVKKENPNAFIIRTNFFCWGHLKRTSFSDWLIYNLRSGNKLKLFDDVYFSPIHADILALAVHDIVDNNIPGVYNVVGDERMSKYDFAIELCKEFGLSNSLLRRESLKNVDLVARRPSDMSLDNEKVRKLLGREMGTVPHFLTMLRLQELEGRRLEVIKAIT